MSDAAPLGLIVLIATGISALACIFSASFFGDGDKWWGRFWLIVAIMFGAPVVIKLWAWIFIGIVMGA